MQTEQELKDNFNDIFTLFEEKGYKLTYFKKKTENLKYMCSCGLEKERLYKDFMRGKECRTCKEKKLKEIPAEKDYIDIDSGEHWKPIVGGWISNLGNAKNSLGKKLTLCPLKFRYHINGKNQYASRIVAEAFKLENYDKLIDPNYNVSHIDKNSLNNNINNLIILTKKEINNENGHNSRQSDTFKEKINWTASHFDKDDIKNTKIPELPKHIIYKNGEIWNGSRFLTFSKTDNYLNLFTTNSSYKVHRLICYAFNPIEGKQLLSTYDDLQVNHKDGNTFNNDASNLEWVSNSKNMLHSYKEKLNKKVRNVLQYTLEGEFIKEYISISDASRETGEPEHRIREISKGKKNSKAEYLWKLKNEDQTKEYSEKYSCK